MLFVAIGLVLVTGIGLGTFWQVARNKQAHKTDKDAAARKQYQEIHQQVVDNVEKINAANKKEYSSVVGITTQQQFENKFPADQRKGKALLTLKQIIDAGKYSDALTFARYIENTYPEVANSIDFAIYGYQAAKKTNSADLLAKYKQKAENILHTGGSLKPGELLPDGYFTGEGQSE